MGDVAREPWPGAMAPWKRISNVNKDTFIL